jgi:NTE family protein
MDNFSVIDFDLRDRIMSSGEKTAMEHFDALKLLAEKQGNTFRPKPQIVIKDTIVVNRLLLNGNNSYTRGYVKGKLRINLGDKTSFKSLQQGISNLAATGNFKTIRYSLTSNGMGEDLAMNLTENPNKSFLRIAAHYDDLYKSAALLNLTKKNVLMNDDVASFDFILGDNIRYNFQYYVDKGSYWSFGINSRFNDFEREIDYSVIQSNFEVPENISINNINLAVSDLTNQIYLQTVVNEEFAFTLGLEHKLLKYSTTTLSEVSSNLDSLALPSPDTNTFFEKSDYLGTYGKLVLDTYDDRYFPTKGLYFNGDFHLYLWSSDFNDNFKEFSISKARMGMAIPLSKNVSLNLETEGGFKLGTSSVSSLDFVLGGYGNSPLNNFVSFLGYDFLSLPGNSYVKAYGRLDFEFASTFLI